MPHRATWRGSTLIRWVGWLAGIAAFALYAGTAAPGIVTFFDDTLEFQTVAATLGIAHPTGYPLYTLLGALWVRLLPIGTWAGRLNLLSALSAAIAVGLLARLTSRLVTHRDGSPNVAAGAAGAICFALGPLWWSQATIAEVYALHGLLVAAILATTTGINQSQHFDRRMTWLLLLFGLGLTHHRTTLLLAPPVALYLLASVPQIWRPRRIWWQWSGALLLPLILYLYIPLRAAAGVQDLNGSYVNTWAGFWNHVLARSYGAFFAENELTTAYTPAEWFDLIRMQSGWLGLILAALGVAWLVDRSWRPARAWWLVLGVLLINLGFALLYRVPDPEVFLLPSLLCLGIFSGGGVGLLARMLPDRAGTVLGTVLAALLVLLLILVPLGRGAAINRHDDWAAHDQARRMAQADFPPDSQVIGLEGEMTALRYLQAVEGLATRATLITANDPEERRARIADAVARGVPVYLTREVAGIGDLYSFSGDADLVRVWPRGAMQIVLPRPSGEPAAGSLPLTLDGGRVQIEAYTLQPVPGLAQPALALTLYWRVLAHTDKTLKLSIRLLDASGAPYLWPAVDGQEGRTTIQEAIEDRFPLHQVALTPQWSVGEVVRDVYTIQLPPALSIAAQQEKQQEESPILLAIIYDSATTLEEGRIQIKF